MSVSIKQLVREQCANLYHENCIMADSDNRRRNPQPWPCPVLGEKRCDCMHAPLNNSSKIPYFELCVLPLADKFPEYVAARRIYLAAHHCLELDDEELFRRCKTPGCGVAVPARKQYCPKCLKERAGQQNRNRRKV